MWTFGRRVRYMWDVSLFDGEISEGMDGGMGEMLYGRLNRFMDRVSMG